MTEERQLGAIQEYDVQGTRLEVYGARGEVRELMTRLLRFHPAARDVGEPGMLAVAQLALLVGANPLPSTNEIHVWVAKGRVTVDLGINYFRRRSRELGGLLWDYEPRIMTSQEYETYGIDPNIDIGAICRGFRSSDLKELIGLGVPAELAFAEASKRKARIGIGTVNRNAEPKKGRPLSWTALKAAEKDLARALFPNLEQADDETRRAILEAVPNVEPSDDEWEGETLDAENAEELARMRQEHRRTMDAWEAKTQEERDATAAANSQLLYGNPYFEGFDTPPVTTSANGPVIIDVEPPPDMGVIGMTPEEYLYGDGEPPNPADRQDPQALEAAEAAAELAEEEQTGDPPEEGEPINLALEPHIIRRACRKRALWLKVEDEDMADAVRQDVEPVNEPIKAKTTLKKVQTVLTGSITGRTTKDRDNARRQVLLYLFNVDSGNRLTELEGQAILDWSQAMGGDHFAEEIEAVLQAQHEEAGQAVLPGM